jgi:hypothetical protein
LHLATAVILHFSKFVAEVCVVSSIRVSIHAANDFTPRFLVRKAPRANSPLVLLYKPSSFSSESIMSLMMFGKLKLLLTLNLDRGSEGFPALLLV